MHREWKQAAEELLAEAGHRGPVRSALALARDLGIDVVPGGRESPARLFGRPPAIEVDERMSRRAQEEHVARELGRYALVRAGFGVPSEFRVRLVAELLIGRGAWPARRLPLIAAAYAGECPSG